MQPKLRKVPTRQKWNQLSILSQELSHAEWTLSLNLHARVLLGRHLLSCLRGELSDLFKCQSLHWMCSSDLFVPLDLFCDLSRWVCGFKGNLRCMHFPLLLMHDFSRHLHKMRLVIYIPVPFREGVQIKLRERVLQRYLCWKMSELFITLLALFKKLGLSNLYLTALWELLFNERELPAFLSFAILRRHWDMQELCG